MSVIMVYVNLQKTEYPNGLFKKYSSTIFTLKKNHTDKLNITGILKVISGKC